MFQVMGSIVDALHALLMVLWVLGLPLLVWHRWPRLSRAYAIYAVSFALLSQLSDLVWDECLLTSISRHLWQSQGGAAAPGGIDEWFTVRFARAVFGLSPSHHVVHTASKILVGGTAAGALFTMHRTHPKHLRATRAQ